AARPAPDAAAVPGQRRRAASASEGSPQAAAPAPAGKTAAGAGPAAVAGPTPEQRQRMLDQAKDDPTALARRKAFLDRIDKGDPEAVDRWRSMQQRRSEGGAARSQ
ncbi:MAG: efflux transporter periplasmic adaptor subunit, partial [Ramlibacter sp.]|nr:efflux transporter periplasmic adaptor subunit [Ramlibacter sp.]